MSFNPTKYHQNQIFRFNNAIEKITRTIFNSDFL